MPAVHADLLENDRRRGRRRSAAWCAAVAVVAVCSVWLLRGPVGAYLQPPSATVVGTVDAARSQATDAPNRPAAAAIPDAIVSSRATPLVQTRPLSAWLGEVAHEAGRDLVVSPEVHGDLTATDGGNLAWEQRLAAFARVFGFDFTLDDGLIEVRPQSRPQPSNREPRGREPGAPVAADEAVLGTASADMPGGSKATAGCEPGAEKPEKPEPSIETRIVPLAHAAAKEMAAVMAKAAEPLKVSVVPELSSNALVVSGTREAIDRALVLLRELDRPRRRVLLEAKIVELTHSARLDLGVDWKLAGDVGADVKFPPPASVSGSAALVLATGGASALDARISAMEADGRVHVVSRPSVVMLEGSPASVESVRILRIRLPSRGSVVGGDVVEVDNGQRATEEIPVGVRLEVTPSVRAGRRVLLRIKAKSSSLGAPLPPDDIPEELSRMVDAELLVANGETAVLGGLQRESGQRSGAGIPVLRDVPLLGNLFGRHSREREDEELVVMVTPRVLD